MHTAKIRFEFPENKRSIIFKSVKPDITSSERATTKLTNDKELAAEIEAKDITALRAAINTLLQAVSASEKAADVVKN